MRLCFVVDARSPIARNWISYFVRAGHDVHVISSHACQGQGVDGATLHEVPIGFGRVQRNRSHGRGSGRLGVVSAFRWLDQATNGCLRSWLTPLDLLPHVSRVRRLCDLIAPDLVHAMRIPYEGIMAALSVRRRPLLISCWGNDFTLFTRTATDRLLTRRAMRRTDALHCDCEKDLGLARKWDFSPDKPSIVLPGAGGVDPGIFRPGEPKLNGLSLPLPEGARVIINARGMRMYVRNDAFFNSIPLVLRDEPRAFFLCPGMQGEPFAHKAVRSLGIADHVCLLPTVSRDTMAELFRLAEISVSPSTHDGTPNTLLEAMASACFPIAGDIESVREWINSEVNGLLCDPASSAALAASIARALRDEELRRRAAFHNINLIHQRARYSDVMAKAELFYRDIISRFSPQIIDR